MSFKILKQVPLYILFFGLGLIIMFFIKQGEVDTNKKIANKVILTSVNIEAVNKEIISIYKSEVNEVLACFSNINCNTSLTSGKFTTWKIQIDGLYRKKDGFANDLTNSIDSL